MSATHELDHRGKSIAKLISVLAKPKMAAMIGVLADELQEVEDAFFDLLTLRILSATGVQLDALGRIVNQARAGLDDPTYLRAILARIVANRSTGAQEDIYRVARAALGLPVGTQQIAIHQVYDNNPPTSDNASFRLILKGFFGQYGLLAVIAKLVGDAKVAGVRAVVEATSFGYGDAFSCAWAWWLPSDVHAGETVIPWSFANGAIWPYNLPDVGQLRIGEPGTTNAEIVDYNFNSPTPGQFNTSALAHDHPTGTQVAQLAGLGLAAFGAFADTGGSIFAYPGYLSNALETYVPDPHEIT